MNPPITARGDGCGHLPPRHGGEDIVLSMLKDAASRWTTKAAMIPGKVSCALVIALLATSARADDINDYPTKARVDYVFGCMKANGETQQTLAQCSCSIDIIASILPYDRYVSAETVLRVMQVPGNLGGEFRSTPQAKAAVDDLRRAQAEAEVRCF